MFVEGVNGLSPTLHLHSHWVTQRVSRLLAVFSGTRLDEVLTCLLRLLLKLQSQTVCRFALSLKVSFVFFPHTIYAVYICIIYICIQLMYTNLNVSGTPYDWRWEVKKFCWLVKNIIPSDSRIPHLIVAKFSRRLPRFQSNSFFHFSKPSHSNTRTHMHAPFTSCFAWHIICSSWGAFEDRWALKSWEFPPSLSTGYIRGSRHSCITLTLWVNGLQIPPD